MSQNDGLPAIFQRTMGDQFPRTWVCPAFGCGALVQRRNFLNHVDKCSRRRRDRAVTRAGQLKAQGVA